MKNNPKMTVLPQRTNYSAACISPAPFMKSKSRSDRYRRLKTVLLYEAQYLCTVIDVLYIL